MSRLPARATRGNRMSTLVAEEEAGEDEFWAQHQDRFADEHGDEEFAEQGEEEDVVDADFDAPEDQPAPEEEEKVCGVDSIPCPLRFMCAHAGGRGRGEGERQAR